MQKLLVSEQQGDCNMSELYKWHPNSIRVFKKQARVVLGEVTSTKLLLLLSLLFLLLLLLLLNIHMRNEMLIEPTGNSEKIRAPDGIRTHDPP